MAKKKIDIGTVNDNTKDGKFVTSNEVNPVVETEVKDPVRDKFLKENELLVKKREKEELLRLAELDVKRTYETAQQLFVNATDYLKNTIVPVHGKHEVLGPYSKILELWLDIFKEWSDGIPLGKDAEWEIIDEKIKEIRKETTRLNKEQLKVKETEIEHRKDELRAINNELSELK